MNYVKQDGAEDNSETFFIEVDDNGVAWRQVVVDPTGKIFTSNQSEGYFPLADQPLTKKDIQSDKIEKAEFEKYWSIGNKILLEKWPLIKTNYPIGSSVFCVFECYFPQGTLFSGNKTTFLFPGLYSFEKGIPMHSICDGRVVGYDDVNMWVKIEITNIRKPASLFRRIFLE